ncbi:hypothetical protein QZH41_001128 [Actinostola sp. cb2023]|nr:hypothetical protein QZH41_001128 [Actinostola sp. cb2023]
MDVKVLKAIGSGLVTFLAIFGNVLVISAVWLVPRMKTVTNYLIINMSVSDVLYIIIAMPPLYIEIFDLHQWVSSSYGQAVYLCKVPNASQYLLITASVLTLACIAADRFFAIILPLRKVFTTKVFHVIVPVIWIIAAGVGAPALYAFKVVYEEGFGFFCVEDWTPSFDTNTASVVYTAVLFSVAYFVPFLSITVMYTIICRRLWTRKILKKRHKKQYQKALESRKKVVKMLITVVVAFTICWLPFQIATFVWHSGINISNTADFICKLLMRVHTCTSPIIYAVFSENYRRGFKMALKCYCYRKKSRSKGMRKQSLRMTLSTRRSYHPKSRDNTADDLLRSDQTKQM